MQQQQLFFFYIELMEEHSFISFFPLPLFKKEKKTKTKHNHLSFDLVIFF